MCGTNRWPSEGVSDPSPSSLRISSSVGGCLVCFRSSVLLMLSGHQTRRITDGLSFTKKEILLCSILFLVEISVNLDEMCVAVTFWFVEAHTNY